MEVTVVVITVVAYLENQRKKWRERKRSRCKEGQIELKKAKK